MGKRDALAAQFSHSLKCLGFVHCTAIGWHYVCAQKRGVMGL